MDLSGSTASHSSPNTERVIQRLEGVSRHPSMPAYTNHMLRSRTEIDAKMSRDLAAESGVTPRSASNHGRTFRVAGPLPPSSRLLLARAARLWKSQQVSVSSIITTALRLAALAFLLKELVSWTLHALALSGNTARMSVVSAVLAVEPSCWSTFHAFAFAFYTDTIIDDAQDAHDDLQSPRPLPNWGSFDVLGYAFLLRMYAAAVHTQTGALEPLVTTPHTGLAIALPLLRVISRSLDPSCSPRNH
ncbi:hypothetical protein OF83DRAFT_870076 [Amylostereum chailletii]|nr:hypothetical protein OF83DRAFT_870076 [Amylostereum chailletii]